MVQIEVTGSSLKRTLRWVVLAVVFVVAVCGLVALINAWRGDPLAGEIKTNRYQAVILTNDRVYFGHVQSLSDDLVKLRHAHYIREKPSTGTDKSGGGQQVAPISEELQGPDSSMLINREQIVLIENLAKDSRVSVAIDGLRKQ